MTMKIYNHATDWRPGLCMCGSGLSRYDLTDARGIFCGYVCDKCETAKRRQYRPEIFSNAGYWHDEPIDED